MSFFKSIFGRFFADGKPQPVKPVAASFAGSAVEHEFAAVEAETPERLTIWTIERSRLAPPRALCTEIEVYPSEAVVLCEDIAGFVFDTPNGESVVVEARTGGLVGHSLEVVRDGVREMTRAQLNAQLDTARKEFNRMKKHELSNEEFWKAIKMGGSEIEVAQDYQE